MLWTYSWAGVVSGTLTVQFACTSFPDDFYCIRAISPRLRYLGAAARAQTPRHETTTEESRRGAVEEGE